MGFQTFFVRPDQPLHKFSYLQDPTQWRNQQLFVQWRQLARSHHLQLPDPLQNSSVPAVASPEPGLPEADHDQADHHDHDHHAANTRRQVGSTGTEPNALAENPGFPVGQKELAAQKLVIAKKIRSPSGKALQKTQVYRLQSSVVIINSTSFFHI